VTRLRGFASNIRNDFIKFLSLAYGDERDWKALTKVQQEDLLRHDEVLRDRGALMAAVKTDVITVTAWDGVATTTPGSFVSTGCLWPDFPSLRPPI